MTSYWIQTKEQFLKTQLYEFTKEFERTEQLRIRISASTRYKLYVNDTYICEGPCQGSLHECCYEEQDVTQYLRAGVNSLRVQVLHVVGDTFTTVAATPKPMLWVEGWNGERPVFVSDDSWHVCRVEGIDFFQGDMVMFSVCHFERHAQEYHRIPLTVEVLREAYLEQDSCAPWGELNLLRLKRSPLPQMTRGTFHHLTVLTRKEGRYILDASAYTTSKILVRVRGRKGDVLRIRYAECFVERADGWKFEKNMRDNQEGLLVGPSDYVELNGAQQEVEFWWYRAFRYLEIASEHPDSLEIEVLHAPSHYPYAIQGSFHCSDETYNKMWEISVNTLLCCSHELFLDCPMFEQQQYCMDAYLEAMYSMQLSNDTRLIEKTISDLAQSQQPDGFLCANYPSRKTQIIASFSVYWIMLVYDYYRHTGDVGFLKNYMGVIGKILDGFDRLLDRDGLVAPKYWSFTDWTTSWPHGVPNYGQEDRIAVSSMLYSMGLLCAERSAVVLGRAGLAIDYRARRDALNAAIREHFWDSQSRYYRDTLHTDGKSQHTAIWAVLAEIETGETARHLAEAMLDENMVQCSFSMGFFLFRALEKTGLYQKADRLFDGFRRMIDLHCTTWCENPDHPRSECHGWSASPLYEFPTQILGVKRTAEGYRTVEISPNTGNLTEAEGTVPTPYGCIAVKWKRSGDGILLAYRAPAEVKIVVQNVKIVDWPSLG